MSRILQLTFEFSPFHGGVGTYAEMMAWAAHQLGHDITVFAPDYGQRLEKLDAQTFPFRVIRFAGSRYSATDTPAIAWRCWQAIRKSNYEIIHAVDLAHVVGLGLLSRFRPVSYLASVHGTEILGASHGRQVRLFRLHDLFARPTRVFTNSEYTRGLLLGRYPNVDPARVTSALLGVDPFWFQQAETSDLRQRLGLEQGRRIVLTVSRLEPRKGHRSVIRALGLLPAALRRQLVYVVTGSALNPQYRSELEALSRGCGVPVRFVGEVDRVTLRALYASAELFCMPGERDPKSVEGFGLAYLEAAAQRVPAIGSFLGGVPEVVQDGQTGVLLPPGRPALVAETLERLLTDPARARAMGRQARFWAEKFSWTRCAAMTYQSAS